MAQADTLDVVTAILLAIFLGILIFLIRVTLDARRRGAARAIASSPSSSSSSRVKATVESSWVARQQAERGPRLALIIDSQVSIIPDAVTEVSAANLLARSFHPDKIVIGDLAGGGCWHGDWVVSDIRINGKSQLSQPASIPGDCFSEGATASGVAMDPMVSNATLIMSVSYVGPLPDGAVFRAIVLGYGDPGTTKRAATKPMYRRPQ